MKNGWKELRCPQSDRNDATASVGGDERHCHVHDSADAHVHEC